MLSYRGHFVIDLCCVRGGWRGDGRSGGSDASMYQNCMARHTPTYHTTHCTPYLNMCPIRHLALHACPAPPLSIDESGSTRQPPSRTDQARPFAMRSVGWSNAGNRNLRALTDRMLARRARSFSSCRSHDLATKAVWQKRKAILWRHRMQKGDRSGEAKVSSPSAWHASRGIRRTFCLH